ncbi:MAG: hypothetical protein KBS52_06735 [Clostridiales bacterium]|nr:hypothetical protein [Candidatus Equinaster intestinalis]
MEKATVKVTKFNSNDVIATSIKIVPGDVPTLWLDEQSVKNFNLFDTTDSYVLERDDYFGPVRYFGYTGRYSEGAGGLITFTAQVNDTTKPSVVEKMAAGDAEKYQLILDWLIGSMN